MFKKFQEKTYKTKFAQTDAKALFDVLGNEEKVMKIITDENITGGKWQYVFDELYKLVEKEDAKILKNYYFDIVKRGDIEILWEGFAHHEEKRKKALESVKEDEVSGFIDSVIADALDYDLELEDLIEKLQARLDEFNSGNSNEEEMEDEDANQIDENEEPKSETKEKPSNTTEKQKSKVTHEQDEPKKEELEEVEEEELFTSEKESIEEEKKEEIKEELPEKEEEVKEEKEEEISEQKEKEEEGYAYQFNEADLASLEEHIFPEQEEEKM